MSIQLQTNNKSIKSNNNDFLSVHRITYHGCAKINIEHLSDIFSLDWKFQNLKCKSYSLCLPVFSQFFFLSLVFMCAFGRNLLFILLIFVSENILAIFAHIGSTGCFRNDDAINFLSKLYFFLIFYNL